MTVTTHLIYLQIPSGIRSAETSELLESDFVFNFKTPYVRITHFVTPATVYVSFSPYFYLEFDQLIEPEKVLNTIKVKVNDKPWDHMVLSSKK